MSLYSFVSAKGSPGVSLAVTTLTSLWSQPAVAADLDPVGGDLALRHRAPGGMPLNEDLGLVSLGAALRGGQPGELDQHLQPTEDGLEVLTGVNSPGQVHGLGTSWPHIATALRTHDADVLADCGRFTPGTPVMPVIEASSAVVFIARSDLEGLAHLRHRLGALQESVRLGTVPEIRVGYALVGDPGETREAQDTERLLASSGLSAKPLGVIAFDPRAVVGLQTESARKLRRSLYIRSLFDVAERLRAFAATRISTGAF